MAERQKNRTIFICQECGQESLRWQGRCPECNAWNTFVERAAPRNPQPQPRINGPAQPVEIASVTAEDADRLVFAWPEFDRVLGGGLVPGSLVLLGGDPGIGKSTLTLQLCERAVAAGQPVLYISGEESAHQLRLRARRLGLSGHDLYVLGEPDLEEDLQAADRLRPALLIVDSIQTVAISRMPQAAGSVAQLRECTQALMRWAKERGTPVVIVGHVTKEGELAGPRMLEHIVDVVLYLEGERFSSYRLLRGVKNRFGAVSEIGVFEMGAKGLRGVDNPSEIFLAERADRAVGSVIAPAIEGSRPMLVEIQALTSPSALTIPRRTAQGIEMSRLLLLTAVLSKRVGLSLATQDVIVNVAGGLRLQEPAADLPVALAIASSFRDRDVASDLVALGEVGLSGELRSCSHLDRRLAEAAKLGFRRCILPAASLRRGRPETPLQLLPAASLREAITVALSGHT
jgi:DNA repair protein RadA/Sms